MTPFVDRMIRAAKLDVHLYEEVEADKSAMGQAMAVVVLSSLAGGVGFMQHGGLMGLVVGTVGSLIGWYIWALLTYLIGTKLLPEPQTHADHGELLRTVGFSSAPGMIRVLAILPGLGTLVNFIASAWMLVAMVIAVRQALDYQSTYRAIGVCLIGWIVQAVVAALLLTLVGGVPDPMLEN
ncbi:YIP1 family protein [Nitrospira sp. M1]